VDEDPSKSEFYTVYEDVPEHELKVRPPSPMPDGLEGLTSDDLHPVARGEQPE
jgi:hypothetical protein